MIQKYQKGFMLISVLMAGALFSVLGLGLTGQTFSQIKKINGLILEKKLMTLAETGVQTFLWQKKYNPQTLGPKQPVHQVNVRKNYLNYLNQAYQENLPSGSFFLIYGQKGDVLCVASLSKTIKSHQPRVLLYYDGLKYLPWQ